MTHVNAVNRPAIAPAPFIPAQQKYEISRGLAAHGSSIRECAATEGDAPVVVEDPNVLALRSYLTAESDEVARSFLALLEPAVYGTLTTTLYEDAALDPVEGGDAAHELIYAAPRDERVVAAAQKVLAGILPAPVAADPVPAEASGGPVEETSNGFIANLCSTLSSYFTGFINWVSSFFSSVEPKKELEVDSPAPVAPVSVLRDDVVAFNDLLNGDAVERATIEAGYAALCATHSEVQAKIEYYVYAIAKEDAPELNPDNEDYAGNFGARFVLANPADPIVKKAVAAYLAELTAPAAV